MLYYLKVKSIILPTIILHTIDINLFREYSYNHNYYIQPIQCKNIFYRHAIDQIIFVQRLFRILLIF